MQLSPIAMQQWSNLFSAHGRFFFHFKNHLIQHNVFVRHYFQNWTVSLSKYSYHGRWMNVGYWPDSTECVLFWHLQYVLEPTQYLWIQCLLCLLGSDKNNLLTKQNSEWLTEYWMILFVHDSGVAVVMSVYKSI